VCFLQNETIELLDVVHIISDSDELGAPEITNGLSLCKIHHAAFDSNLNGITPEFKIKVREDVLKEEYGLTAFRDFMIR